VPGRTGSASGRSRGGTRWATLASSASAAALLLAGCGSPTAAQRGHAIFEHDCASCHTLTGHETAVDGGDLAVGHLSVADVASFARAMPVRRTLSRRDAADVARYVVSRRR
jgi:mono/diheme cytochrome c family protein